MARTKITIIGDIMCEPRLLRAARKANGGYDFQPVFRNVKGLFSEADYVVGNLETPLAGEKAGYTAGYFSFNAPAELADAVKDAGINLVSTMNNHCLDRGYAGVEETLRILDDRGISHTGTYGQKDDRERFFTFSANGIKVALVAYGTHTNYTVNHVALTEEQEKSLNLLKPQREAQRPSAGRKKDYRSVAVNKLLFFLDNEQRYAVKKKLGIVKPKPSYDTDLDAAQAEPYIRAMQESIRRAKTQADLVVFYPHLLGQFNPEPGVFSRYVVDKALEAGCDAVIGSHPHIVQKAEWRCGVPCLYSIGNFSMSPNSVYLVRDNLPQYGLAVHLYLEDAAVVRVTFSVLKIVEEPGRVLTVYPVDELAAAMERKAERQQLERDVARICRTVSGRPVEGEIVRREYELRRDSIGDAV